LGEVGAKIAAVFGGESVGLQGGVCADEKIRDQVLPWSARPAIGGEGLARMVRRGEGERIEGEAQIVEGGGQCRTFSDTGGEFGDDDIADHETTLGPPTLQRFQPRGSVRLTFENGEQDRGIDGGFHARRAGLDAGFGSGGSATAPRVSSRRADEDLPLSWVRNRPRAESMRAASKTLVALR